MMLLLAALSAGSSFAAGFPEGYLAARQKLEKMEKSGAPPAQWTELAAEFQKIYEKNPAWQQRYAALYRSGAALEGRARVTKAPADARKAVQTYEKVYVAHPRSVLADDALYHAAKVSDEILGDRKKSAGYLASIQKQYPKSDHAASAASYMRTLNASEKPAARAEAKPSPAQKPAARPEEKTGAKTPAKTDAKPDARTAGTHQAAQPAGQAGAKAAKAEGKDSAAPMKAEPAVAPKKGEEKRQGTGKAQPAAAQKTAVNPPEKSGTKAPENVDGKQPQAGEKPAKPEAKAGSGPQAKQPDGKAGAKAPQAEQKGTAVSGKAGEKSAAKKGDGKPPQGIGKKSPAATAQKPAAGSPEKPGAAPVAKPEAKAAKPLAAVQAGAKPPQQKPQAKPSGKAGGAKRDGARTLASQLGLSVHTIVLDPGHGGKDPGTSHNGVTEKSVNLSLALKIKAILEKHGYEVLMTRSTDKWITLGQRVRFGRKSHGDLFVSIHVNACDNPKISGMETYILDFARTSAASRLAMLENADSGRLGDMDRILSEILRGARTRESQRLASCIQREAVSYLKRHGSPTYDGGVKGAPFFVLVGSSMPSVLVEVGYCTNIDEAARLKNEAHIQRLAEGLAIGIQEYAVTLRGRR